MLARSFPLRRPIWLVASAFAAALVVVGEVGLRVLDRDRQALHASFAHERLQGLEETARALAANIAEIGEDLELAATLLERAESSAVADRELHAVATIKREYLVIAARDADAPPHHVVALDAPAGIVDQVDHNLTRALAVARREPGTVHVSDAAATTGSWYRIFASLPRGRRHAVAVVVDTAVLLARLKLVPEPMSLVVVLDADGTASPRTEPQAAARVLAEPRTRELIARTRDGAASSASLPGALAGALGLPATVAVATAVPLVVDARAPWTLLHVRSTAVLEAQETTLVRRIVVLACLVLALVLAAATYVIRNARRAATLRESLRQADRLAHLTDKAEKIVDHIPSGVLALSETHQVTSANRWFVERVGDGVVGKPLASAFAGADAADVAMLVRLVEDASRMGSARSLFRTRLGVVGPDTMFNIHAVPLARGIGDVSMLLVFDDLTEQRRIEEQLLHSEKLVTAGQLAAGIAHEVGTPLNIARGRAELLQARMARGSQDAANHQIIIDQIDRVTRLIQQLLDYVRPGAITTQAIDLARAMHATAELLAPEAGKRGVDIRCEPTEGLAVAGDPDRMQQLLVNLVMNGIDACKRGGVVTIRAFRSEGVVLEVTDDGEGIPPEVQAHVFDPFFTTKKRGQGTGLGLWVVAGLVRAQAGELALDSAAGRGTTMRIRWRA